MAGLGTCIRCNRPVADDPDRPLCDDCYAEWAQWGNWEHPEHYCHDCGKKRETSYARPLCRACYFAR
jgi:NMD protein affecting ribosome stability and mRNA decay